jgi:hypothetical protein
VLLVRDEPQAAVAVLDAFEDFQGSERPFQFYTECRDDLRVRINEAVKSAGGNSASPTNDARELRAVVRAAPERTSVGDR